MPTMAIDTGSHGTGGAVAGGAVAVAAEPERASAWAG